METYNSNNGDQVAGGTDRSRSCGGLFSLPVVAPAAAITRQFYDEMAPQPTDATEVRVAKEIFRWSSVIAGAAAVAVAVL